MKNVHMSHPLTLIMVAILITTSLPSDPAWCQKLEKVRPEFVPPTIDARLPNVLLIGDSISIGYTLAVRSSLKDTANVFRPATNCGPTTRGLQNIESWLRDTTWDLIHFNFGLHDLKYQDAAGKIVSPDTEGAAPQVPIDEYADNIRRIAQRLKKTGAIIIWRETTPVPEGANGRMAGDAVRYNEAARKVIESVGGIQLDPMFSFATENEALQLPANVHYTNEGSKRLGNHVAEIIGKSLANR